jgi:pyrophosphatase PpaX
MSSSAGTAAVLFDLDGTLIDSIELIRRSYRHTMEVHTGSIPEEEFWLAGLGRPLTWQFSNFSDDPEEIQSMIDTYREHNMFHHDDLVRGYPGLLEAVSELKSGGLRLGVVTSKLHSAARRGLNHCGYDGLFDVLIGADDVDRPKPDPEPVLRALEMLNATAQKTFFVGDSPHDISAGRAAGVRTAAALWGPFPRASLEPERPDRWLVDPKDVASLLRM